MKNRAVAKYIGRVGAYTLIFFASAAVAGVLFFFVGYPLFTNILSGRIREFAAGVYDFVSRNFPEMLVALYVIGLGGLTLKTIAHFGKFPALAENAIHDENSVLYGDSCPEELRSFASAMKDFRNSAIINEQARRLSEQQKNDLIVYLAHDLKTPLTSVIGYLCILEESPDLPADKRAKYVGITLDKAYRLEQLINEFFEITRLNLSELSLDKTCVDLSVMLFQLTEEFYPCLTENRMTLIPDIESGIKLSADADKLARAFDNLLRNAVNYGWSDAEIKLCARTEGESAVVTLSNKGDEIPREKLARIFDKFCRLDSSRRSKTGGAGLGLAITKQIIELHGGSISADCNGNDITFSVILPL